MRAAFVCMLLLLAGCAQPSGLLEIDAACIPAWSSHAPMPSLDFTGGVTKVYAVVPGICDDLAYEISEEGGILAIRLEGVCADNCTGEFEYPSTMVGIPVDFSEHGVQGVTAYHNGALLHEYRFEDSLCFPGMCPAGYVCANPDAYVPPPSVGPSTTCKPIGCTLENQTCAAGYSCFMERGGKHGACVKDIPVDYCEQVWDCVRQDIPCDCGLGEWVNQRFYQPLPPGVAVCKCAMQEAEPACVNNRCMGRVPEYAYTQGEITGELQTRVLCYPWHSSDMPNPTINFSSGIVTAVVYGDCLEFTHHIERNGGAVQISLESEAVDGCRSACEDTAAGSAYTEIDVPVNFSLFPNTTKVTILHNGEETWAVGYEYGTCTASCPEGYTCVKEEFSDVMVCAGNQ